jgi:hypothetical protein
MRFFSAGFGLKLFPSFYLIWKCLALGTKGRALGEAILFYLHGKLEYGHYSTPTELAHAQDCPVCFDRLYVPVTLKCNHVFCEHCIYEWLDKEKTCPVCRAEVENESLYVGPLKDEMAWAVPVFI